MSFSRYYVFKTANLITFACLIVFFFLSGSVFSKQHDIDQSAFMLNNESFDFAIVSSSIGNVHALSMKERIACQQAIEKVYWKHRIWPGGADHPKPLFESIISESALIVKAEDVLYKVNALANYWNIKITGADLQNEINRMARDIHILWSGREPR